MRRIGIDLGGTKIAAIGLEGEDRFTSIKRSPTPRGDYHATIEAMKNIAGEIEDELGGAAHIGIGMPGSISPDTGLVQNANSTWLNGRAFENDLARDLERPLRLANDANCFALSEAVDGAGAGTGSIFGIIIGTGCGGGLIYDGRVVDGRHRIGGEWGHNPLPWAEAFEFPGPECWCGRRGCMETWVSGPGLAGDHERHTGEQASVETIAERAQLGDKEAQATIGRHSGRLARGIAAVVNVFDPERIVLGGGLSNLTHLYDRLPDLMAPHIFADAPAIDIRPPRHGDMSGTRGAARLWRLDEVV